MAALIVTTLVLCGAGAALGAELPFLLELQSERVSVRYSPGSLDRASRVMERFDLLLEEVGGRRGPALGLAINLLSREEWEASGIEIPYGLPAEIGPRELALAAWGDAGTVALWQRLAGAGVPRLNGTPVRGTRAEAESLSALDLVTEIEAVRMLLPVLEGGNGSDWWDPLLAHTLAGSAFLRYEAARAEEIARLFAHLEAQKPSGSDSRGGAAERIHRYAPYAFAARSIAATEERPPAKPLLGWLRKGAQSKSVREREENFRARYPAVAEWLASQSGGGSSAAAATDAH